MTHHISSPSTQDAQKALWNMILFSPLLPQQEKILSPFKWLLPLNQENYISPFLFPSACMHSLKNVKTKCTQKTTLSTADLTRDNIYYFLPLAILTNLFLLLKRSNSNIFLCATASPRRTRVLVNFDFDIIINMPPIKILHHKYT